MESFCFVIEVCICKFLLDKTLFINVNNVHLLCCIRSGPPYEDDGVEHTVIHKLTQIGTD